MLQTTLLIAGAISIVLLYSGILTRLYEVTFNNMAFALAWSFGKSMPLMPIALTINFCAGIIQAFSKEAAAINGSWPWASPIFALLGLSLFALGKMFEPLSKEAEFLMWLSPWMVMGNIIAVTIFIS